MVADTSLGSKKEEVTGSNSTLVVGNQVRYIGKGHQRDIIVRRQGTWFILEHLECDLVLVGRNPDRKILNDILVTKIDLFELVTTVL
jgi:hypothetical protein